MQWRPTTSDVELAGSLSSLATYSVQVMCPTSECMCAHTDHSRVAPPQSFLSSSSHSFLTPAPSIPQQLSTAQHLVISLLRASEKALTKLLLSTTIVKATLPLSPPPPLLNQSVAGLAQVAHLVVLHALEPVAEAGADEAVDGVGEEALAVEEGAHLDAELP